MANKKISEYTELTAGQVAVDDYIELVDSSAGDNKKAKVASLMLGGFSEVAATPSSDQNDYAPTGFASSTTQMRLNIGATMKLTGLSAGAAGQTVTIVNASTDYLLWLENQSSASSAANRFILPKGFPAFLLPDDAIVVRYDSTSSRWRVSHWASQGDAMGLTYFNDMTDATIPGASGAYIMDGLMFKLSGGGTGGGTVALADSTEKPFGVVSLNQGSGGGAWTSIASDSKNIPWGQGCLLWVSRVALPAVDTSGENGILRTGVNDGGANSASPQNGFAWESRWNGSAAEWSQVSYSGGAATRTNTGSPSQTANAFIWLIGFVNANGTRVDMIYSDDSVTFTKAGGISSGLPSAGTAVGMEAMVAKKSNGSTNRTCHIDFYGWRYDGVRG